MNKQAFIPNLSKVKNDISGYIQYDQSILSKKELDEFFEYVKNSKNENLGIILNKSYDEKKIWDFLKYCNYNIELAKLKINFPIFHYINDNYYNKIDITNTNKIIKNNLYENRILKKEKESEYKLKIENLLKENKKINNEELNDLLNEFNILKVPIPNILKIEINRSKNLKENIDKLIKEEKKEDVIDQYWLEFKEIKIEPNNYFKLLNIKNKIDEIKQKLINNLHKELNQDNIDSLYNEISNYELNSNEFKIYKNNLLKCKQISEKSTNLLKKVKRNGIDNNILTKINSLKEQAAKYNFNSKQIYDLEDNYEEYLFYINRVMMIFEDYNNFYDKNELEEVQLYFEMNKTNNKKILDLIKLKKKLIIDYNYIANHYKNKKNHNQCLEKYSTHKKYFDKNKKILNIINFIENFEKIDSLLYQLNNDLTIYGIFKDNKKIKELTNFKIIEKRFINLEINNIDNLDVIKKKYNNYTKLYDLYNNRENKNIKLELKLLNDIINNGIINDNLIKNIYDFEKILIINYHVYQYISFNSELCEFFDKKNISFYKNIVKLDFNYIIKNKDKISSEYLSIFEIQLNLEKKRIWELYKKYNGQINMILDSNKIFYYEENLEFNLSKIESIYSYEKDFNNIKNSDYYKNLVDLNEFLKDKINNINQGKISEEKEKIDQIDLFKRFEQLGHEYILDYDEYQNIFGYFEDIEDFKLIENSFKEFNKLNKFVELNTNSILKKNKIEEYEILTILSQFLSLKLYFIKTPLLENLKKYFIDYVKFLNILHSNEKKTFKDVKNIINKYVNLPKLHNRYYFNLKSKFIQYDIYIKEIRKWMSPFNKNYKKKKDYIINLLKNYDFLNIKMEENPDEEILSIINNKFNLNNKNNDLVRRQRKVNQNFLEKFPNKKSLNNFRNLIIDEDEEPYCICRTNFNFQNMICCDFCEEWFHYDCIKITKIVNESKFECAVCEYIKIIVNKKDTISSLLHYLLKRKIKDEELYKIYRINELFKEEFKGEEIDYIDDIKNKSMEFKLNVDDYLELSKNILIDLSDELKTKSFNLNIINNLYINLKNICYSYLGYPFIIENIESIYKALKSIYIVKDMMKVENISEKKDQETLINSIKNSLDWFIN